MARIPMMGSTYQILPEGHYVFHIDEVSYDEAFGKLEVKMTTVPDGKRHTERFTLLNAQGEYNEPAMMAFSWLAKVAMQDEGMADCDPTELVGHYFQADVEHDVKPNRNHPEKNVTFVKLNNKDRWTPEGAAPAETTAEVDLDALLN